MKAMCHYIYGSMYAFGVQFSRIDPWPGIQSLGGVPLLVREFTNGAAAT
jgi:hypothetical protein